MAETTKKTLTNKKIKLAIEIVFFAGLLALALIYVLKDDPLTTFSMLGQAQFFPLLLAIITLFVTILLDGLNITLLAKLYNPKYKFQQGLINVCVGQTIGVFVKTGASIIQAYTFPKQDIKSAQSASILTMNYLMYQLSLFIYSLFIVILGYPTMKEVPLSLLGNLPVYIIAIIGLVVQLFFLFGIISLAYWRGMHRLVLNSGINLLAKLHLLRNPEETRRKLTLQFVTYRVEMKRLFQNKKLVLALFLSNMLKSLLLSIIPFLIFWALQADMNQLHFMQSLYGTGYVDVIASFLNVGAPEVMFQSTFSYFLGGATNLASAANLLWRSVTFYLLFIIGILSMAFYRGAPKRHQLLSNTATIYDLEIANIKLADEKTQEYLRDVRAQGKRHYAPLLSEKDVLRSFEKIKENMFEVEEEEEEEKIDDSDLESILQEQRKHLADIEKEVSLAIEKDKPDEEIAKEAKEEIAIQNQKKAKRLAKKKAKAKKKLEKYQIPGTTYVDDDKNHIRYIFNDEITVVQSMPTSEEESQDDEKE